MRDERMRNFRGPVAPICASLHMDNKRRLKKKTEKKGVITFSPCYETNANTRNNKSYLDIHQNKTK